MGKTSINGSFSMAMLNNQRVHNITKICHRISMIIIHDQRSIIGLSSNTMSSDGTSDRCESLDQNDQAMEMGWFRS